MTKSSKVRSVETLSCDAGWRNYHFVKITTEDGVIGWSEFDEGFGSPGLGAAIQRLSARVVGQNALQHERIHAELFAATRPSTGGVIAHHGQPDRILKPALARAAEVCMSPVSPETVTDHDYVLAAAGLLLSLDADLAARVAICALGLSAVRPLMMMASPKGDT